MEKADPTTPSSAYTSMMSRWKLLDTVNGGTESLRKAGKRYLPQHAKESDEAYRRRLSVSVNPGHFQNALNTLAGRPFRYGFSLPPDTHQDLLEVAGTSFDGKGQAAQLVAAHWFRQAWLKGVAYALVDVSADTGKPFTKVLEPEQVLAVYTDEQGAITYARVTETYVQQDGFGEKAIQLVRELTPGHWRVWQSASGKGDWTVVGEGDTSLPYVPLVPFYTAPETQPGACVPPLLELANLAVAYWQSASDQQNVLTVSRFPILAASGVPADAEVQIGPNNFLASEDTAGKWYYVEHSGAAIAAGRSALEDLEAQMSKISAELMSDKAETATGRLLDASEATTTLAATTQAFKHAFHQVLRCMSDWLKVDPPEGLIDLEAGLTTSLSEPGDIDNLLKLQAQGMISRQALLVELKEREFLSNRFDIEADLEQLEAEGVQALSAEMASADHLGIDGGGADLA